MAITAGGYPFPDIDTTADQFSRLLRMLQDDGVDDSPGSTSGQVTAGSGFTVNVGRFDRAFLGGVVVGLDAAGTVTLDNAASQTRIDRIVIRANSNTKSAVVDKLSGTPGVASPAGLTQTPGGIYEISLATITVPAGAANVVTANIADTRQFTSQRVREHTTATRLTPYKGRFAYNHTSGKLEVANGSSWDTVGATPQWADILGKPTPTDTTLFAGFESGWALASGGSTGRADGFKQGRLATLEFQIYRIGSAIAGETNGNIGNTKMATLTPDFYPVTEFFPLSPSAGGPVRTAYVDSAGGVWIAALLPNQDILSGAEITFGATYLTSS
jgi:hypothetical protein